MRRILISAAAALALLVAGGGPSPQASAPGAPTDDTSLEALLAADCDDDTAMGIAQASNRRFRGSNSGERSRGNKKSAADSINHSPVPPTGAAFADFPSRIRHAGP